MQSITEHDPFVEAVDFEMSRTGFKRVLELQHNLGMLSTRLKLKYIIEDNGVTCKIELAFCRMGPAMLVTGKVSSDPKSYTISFKEEDLARNGLTRMARILLINNLVRPIQVEVAHAAKTVGPPSLENLPYDLFERIMLIVEPEDVVAIASTCKGLKTLGRSDSVWEALFNREFKEPTLQPGIHSSWHVSYKLEAMKKREREKEEAESRRLRDEYHKSLRRQPNFRGWQVFDPIRQRDFGIAPFVPGRRAADILDPNRPFVAPNPLQLNPLHNPDAIPMPHNRRRGRFAPHWN